MIVTIVGEKVKKYYFHPLITQTRAVKIRDRYKELLGWFAVNMPVAETELGYSDPFQLIVAVILISPVH
ncbi:MAG: hypothetical protein MZV63_61995 [Marinilabiliales bacterium]|nr:hypothetical protein [Marinilabiliales bacterium]